MVKAKKSKGLVAMDEARKNKEKNTTTDTLSKDGVKTFVENKLLPLFVNSNLTISEKMRCARTLYFHFAAEKKAI